VFGFFAIVSRRPPSVKVLRPFADCLGAFFPILYGCKRLASVSHDRSAEIVASLSHRFGVWRQLTAISLRHPPWFGLGYYSASRIHGPEYNPFLGTAHSMFFEVLSGGGLVSFALFLALCVTLSTYTVRLLYLSRDRFSFAYAALFIACLLLGFTGETIDSGPLAISFWCSAAVLPRLHKWSLGTHPRLQGVALHAPP